MKKIDGDSVATMPVPKKVQKKTSPNGGGTDSYRDVEILRPVVSPSVALSKITEAIRYVMNNDKLLQK